MQQNKPYQHNQNEAGSSFPRNLVTQDGVVRCRFDIFIRYPESAGKKINPICRRGDKYGITEPAKMLVNILEYFIGYHHQWLIAELYDNSLPINDVNRKILVFKGGKIITNRLHHYKAMLQEFALPEWLKPPIPQPEK